MREKKIHMQRIMRRNNTNTEVERRMRRKNINIHVDRRMRKRRQIQCTCERKMRRYSGWTWRRGVEDKADGSKKKGRSRDK